jgi:cell division protein FtsQ
MRDPDRFVLRLPQGRVEEKPTEAATAAGEGEEG